MVFVNLNSKPFLIENMVRIVLVLCIIFLAMPVLQAQVDGSNNSTIIPAESNQSDGESSLDIKPIENNGLSNPSGNRINGMSVPNSSTSNNDDQFSMFPKEKFGNPGELYENKMNKLSEGLERKPDERISGSTTDQYLGDFKTKSKKVTIAYRDYGTVDGDIIRVLADDDVMKPRAYLGSSFGGFDLELKEGFNKIDFQALNQGELGPNTAELVVLDEEGNVIAQKYWALATGVKATIIVVKE